MTSFNDKTFPSPSIMPDYLIRHVTFRQLQVFEAIYRLGSFTKAAEELFLTQPTVSMQMRKLTDAMGLPLFEHVGRNVQSTEAGRVLYEACRNIFASLANLEMNMADLKGLKLGKLQLGVVTTAKYIAPEMLGEFSRQYPGIDLSLEVSNRDTIIERMHANADDLYIMGQAPKNEIELVDYKFAPNPLVIVAPRDHPLVGKKNIPLEEIANEPFIIRESGSGVRDAILRKFESQNLKPKIRMELGDNEAIKHAVVGGLGLSVLSLHTLLLEGRKGPVVILDVEGFPILRNWYLVHPKGKDLSLIARTFLEFAVGQEQLTRNRLIELWPELKEILNKEAEQIDSSPKMADKKTKKKKVSKKKIKPSD